LSYISAINQLSSFHFIIDTGSFAIEPARFFNAVRKLRGSPDDTAPNSALSHFIDHYGDNIPS